jgi:long-chain acyl-CoA synthetase
VSASAAADQETWEPVGMNLAGILVTTAERVPDDPALRVGDDTVSYRQLLDVVRSTAGWLRERGVRPGDRIALILPNVPAFPALFYGALFAGATVVPMNPLLAEREIGYYFSDAGVRLAFAFEALPDGGAAAAAAGEASGVEVVVVGPRGLAEADLAAATPVEGPEARADDDLAVLLYTSGTTGRPKGASLTHHNLAANAGAAGTELLRTGAGDVVMGCLPLFHVFGLTCGLNTSVLTGACLALLPRFDPVKALELIDRHKVTVFEGVPTMYSALLHAPDTTSYDTSSLRLCLSGGSALPVEVLHSFEERFDATILEGYGLSETSPVVSFNHPDRERKPGSIGTPIEGVEVRIVDDSGAELPTGEVGELAVRGHCVMSGYWNNPDATAEAIPDGWFRTGDLGRADEEGYLYIVDRKKQLIIRGGYNVYPREVEEALYEHPAVAEVAVVGLKHASLGEEVGAAVALAPGASATPDELREFVKKQVAAYKYPRHIWLVDALPKGPTGKILHREVVPPTDVAGG